MPSEKFRYQLRQELKLWQAEGLINQEFYEQISQKYQLDNLEATAQNRLMAIFMGLGAVLVGLAGITFVAANWQAWSREFRVFLLLSLLVGVNWCGFYLWRTPATVTQGWKQRFGHGLLLLGAILLGANLGLGAQMFHITGSPYGLYLIWGLGVLVMAYSLRLTSLGVLAIILVGIGYNVAILDGFSRGFQDGFSLKLLIDYMPIVGSILFIPLAYWCRSRAVFGLSALGIIASLFINIVSNSSAVTKFIQLISILSIYALPPALLWGYDDRIWPKIRLRYFQPLARNLGLFYLAILVYFSSFQFVWDNINYTEYSSSIWAWKPLISVLFFLVITVAEWVYLISRNRSKDQDKNYTLFIGMTIILGTAIYLWDYFVSPIPILAIVFFNVVLFLLAIGLIRSGLKNAERWVFWRGILILSLQIITRIFEYNTGLLFKALILLLCGVGVFGAGWYFERASRRLISSDNI